MAILTLKLKKNEITGSQELVVDYESDGDALPFEHEEEHKQILDKILSGSKDSQSLAISRDSVETQPDCLQSESSQKEKVKA